MNDNITTPFPAAPWKFEPRHMESDGKRVALLLVTQSGSAPHNDPLILPVREDFIGKVSEQREYAKSLIEQAPDLFLQLAGSVDDLEDLAIKYREEEKNGCADEIESRIVEIRALLAKATSLAPPAGGNQRFLVRVRSADVMVTAKNPATAERYARDDIREFALKCNWEIARSAMAAPYLELTTVDEVQALAGFAIERTTDTAPEYYFCAYMNVVVEADSPESADAAARQLFAHEVAV
ncbi:hypothetical protein [Burkholderia sp. Ac-20365]|uniref:hypothetical protein n=1 Tax=Burkholderia sp. Ac-20365 TaxID=2703897 RepID=UPI00197B906C|nr:hypothetical protein [Burkholderia sp. Ac-20365]MBN3761316.1 hypothetical protein [Burkholderia sp. Ac-20365]